MRVGIAGAVRGAGFIVGLRSEGDRATIVAVYDPIQSAREEFAKTHEIEFVCGSSANFSIMLTSSSCPRRSNTTLRRQSKRSAAESTY